MKIENKEQLLDPKVRLEVYKAALKLWLEPTSEYQNMCRVIARALCDNFGVIDMDVVRSRTIYLPEFEQIRLESPRPNNTFWFKSQEQRTEALERMIKLTEELINKPQPTRIEKIIKLILKKLK